MKKGFYKLVGETYPYDIVVCLGTTREEILAHFKKKFIKGLTKDDEEKLEMTGHGLTLRLDNKAFILWLAKYPRTSEQFGYLAHEIFHVADIMLRSAGLTLSDDSDEAWAYHIHWITRNIYKAFKF